MSGPRGGLGLGLVPLSGEAEPEERSEDSDEALFQFRLMNFKVKQMFYQRIKLST